MVSWPSYTDQVSHHQDVFPPENNPYSQEKTMIHLLQFESDADFAFLNFLFNSSS